jgi:hypothetical protein
LKRARNRTKNELVPAIGSHHVSDLPISGLKEIIMAKKKKAKKKVKK